MGGFFYIAQFTQFFSNLQYWSV